MCIRDSPEGCGTRTGRGLRFGDRPRSLPSRKVPRTRARNRSIPPSVRSPKTSPCAGCPSPMPAPTRTPWSSRWGCAADGWPARCAGSAPGRAMTPGRCPRAWRHLDFGRWRVQLRAGLRRGCCPTHGVRVEAVPFARHRSGFTAARCSSDPSTSPTTSRARCASCAAAVGTCGGPTASRRPSGRGPRRAHSC